MTDDAPQSAWNAIGIPPRKARDKRESASDSASAMQVSERRDGDRQPLTLNACLIPPGSEDDIFCTTDDVGELGMHVTVPVGYGMAVGQRYRLLLAQPGSTIGMGPLLPTEGISATVVRAELQRDTGRIGVGLRFDQPLLM